MTLLDFADPTNGGKVPGGDLLPTPRPCSGKRSSGLNRTEMMDALEARGGLLPTPTASSGGASDGAGRQGGPNLAHAAKQLELESPRPRPEGLALLPTPTVQDAENTGGPAQHRRNSLPLNAAVMYLTSDGLLTTPTAGDTRYRSQKYAQGGTALSTQAGGALNPEWVEWLMGFPLGWTDCVASAMQLSRQ
jgi:hypothetical protein